MVIKIFRTLTLLLLAPAFANAQIEPGTGLFTPGTSFEMTTVNAEPVFWVNASGEANAYFVNGGNVVLLTLLNMEPADIRPEVIGRVSYSDHGFFLHGKKDAYFFGTGTNESEQYKAMMKYTVAGDIHSYKGNGVARHWRPSAKAPKLADLKAANSVYDVFGK